MPPKDVRAIINTLFQEGIIDIQEVPNKSGNFITLYYTNPIKVETYFIERITKSLLNVLIKMNDIKSKLDNKQTSWTQDQQEASYEAIEKLCFVINNLEYTIMIFNEF